MRHVIQPEPSVLDRLRLATRALHTRIDSHLPLARRDAGVAAYTAHLQALEAWLGQVAPALSAFEDGPSGFAAATNQTSLDLLARDLAAAGLTTDQRATPAALHPSLARPAFRWGIQYVIEGSYMGAGMLHRRLAPVLLTCPMHFFAHVAADGKGRWASFSARIADEVVGDASALEAEAGAVHAFEQFMHLSDLYQKNADDRTCNHA